MALVDVELETLVSETDALTTRPSTSYVYLRLQKFSALNFLQMRLVERQM